MSIIGRRLFGSLQEALKIVSQRPLRRTSSLTEAMADQLAQARAALAEGRAQDVVDDNEASLDTLVMLLAATEATIGSAYDRLNRGHDRDQAFRYAAKLFAMTSAQPGPAEIVAIVPALDARGKRGQAIEALRAVAASHPDDVPVAQLLASELEQAGDPATAAAYADLARRLGPAEVAEQITVLRKATSLDSQNLEFRASLGGALLRAGDAAAAVPELRAAIAGLPPDHDANVWLAEAVRASGSPSDALSIIDPIVANYPDNAAARVARADIYAELGELEAALEDLDHAIGADPASLAAERARAQLLARLGRYQEAIAACDLVLQQTPTDGHILMSRGEARYALRELDESVKDFSQAAKLAEAADDALLMAAALSWQGEALRMLRQYSEALTVLDQAVAACPPSAFTLGTRGQVLAALGRREEAIEALTAASEADPSLLWVHAALADVYRLERQWGQALAEVGLASINGETAYTHRVRGQVLAGQGKTQEAAEELRAACALQRSPEIVEELASVLALLGRQTDLEESLAAMDQAVSDNTATRSLLIRRAETLRMLGRPNEALTALDQILADGEDSNVLGLKALVLADLGQGAEALGLAKAVLDREPKNLFALSARIEAYMVSNEYEDALDAADSLLADVPRHPLGVVLKGAILSNVARYRDAVQTLMPLLEDDPSQPLANALVGHALCRQDPPDPQKAVDYLDRATREDPGEAWYQIELADALDLLDREAEAREIRQRVVDNTPTGSQVTARKLGYAGWAALFLDRPDDAVTLLGEGVQLDSADLPLRFAFALALLHTGQDELAADEYEAVIAACGQLKSEGYRVAILAEALSDLRRTRQRGRLDAVRMSAGEIESRLSAALQAKEG